MVNPVNKREISDSQFNMWRAVIAIAHADGEVQPEERAFLDKTFQKLDAVYNLTDAQRKTLADEMVKPEQLQNILPLITEPQFRAMLVHFGEVLAWADNVISVDEEAILKKLHNGQMDSLEMNRLRADVRRQVEAQKRDHAEQMKKIHDDKRNPLFHAVDRLCSALGFDFLG